jgi:sugar O-acyltransferase (sialic acid O-acetyltransferase NeuD family)
MGFFDPSFRIDSGEKICGYPILGTEFIPAESDLLVLASGDNHLRAEQFRKYFDFVVRQSIIHTSAKISARANIGLANLFFAGTIINAETVLGDNNIINSGCIIEHETSIGSNCHVSVGAILAGRVRMGSYCFIGAGSVVIDKISICDNVIVGANSTVLRDINEPGVYVGTPARKIK